MNEKEAGPPMRISIALLGLLLTLTACASQPATTSSANRVAITLTDSGLKAEPATAPAGPVTFVVTNAGSVVHSFTVLKTTLAQDKVPADPADPSRVQEGGKVGTTGQVPAVQTKELTLDLKSGGYVLLCNEPGHYLVGMHAAFTAK